MMLNRAWSPILVASTFYLFGFEVRSGHAQETPLLDSATQPSKGTFLLRQQVRGYYGSGDFANQLSLPFSVATGVARAHSVGVDGAGNFSRLGSGLSDITLSWKWRFHSHNFGPISTSRTALITGLQVPTGTGGWGTGSFNPSLGLAHTSIIGRLGLGATVEYKFNTGSGAEYDITGMDSSSDAVSVGASALWRLSPVTYTSTTKGAWYAGLEGEVIQGVGGAMGRLGPSLMYEAEIWVMEAGYQFYPLSTGGMAKIDGMIFAGMRFFF